MRHANIKHGSFHLEEHNMRITRARARVSGSSGRLPPLHPSTKQDKKQALGAESKRSKRSASDENRPGTSSIATGVQPKRRAVLKDMKNVLHENSHMNCINGSKIQVFIFVDTQCSPFGNKNNCVIWIAYLSGVFCVLDWILCLILLCLKITTGLWSNMFILVIG